MEAPFAAMARPCSRAGPPRSGGRHEAIQVGAIGRAQLGPREAQGRLVGAERNLNRRESALEARAVTQSETVTLPPGRFRASEAEPEVCPSTEKRGRL